MSKREEAMKLFKAGYNCCQAVVGAFSDDIDIGFKTAMLISSSFGGGMGRMREVCGTVSGMLMVLGLRFGYSNPKAFAEKTEHYKRVQECAGKFKEKNGSIICRELLGLGLKRGEADSHIPSERSKEYYKKRPCVDLVGDAAEILEKFYIK